MKQGVHNGWLLHKQDTIPKKINVTLLLCDKFLAKAAKPTTGHGGTTPGVVCAQQGILKEEGDMNKEQGMAAV